MKQKFAGAVVGTSKFAKRKILGETQTQKEGREERSHEKHLRKSRNLFHQTTGRTPRKDIAFNPLVESGNEFVLGKKHALESGGKAYDITDARDRTIGSINTDKNGTVIGRTDVDLASGKKLTTTNVDRNGNSVSFERYDKNENLETFVESNSNGTKTVTSFKDGKAAEQVLYDENNAGIDKKTFDDDANVSSHQIASDGGNWIDAEESST